VVVVGLLKPSPFAPLVESIPLLLSRIFTLLAGGLEIVQVSQALENDVFESKTFVY